MNFYQMFGVHKDASTHAIKQAYRRLVKAHHPDHNPNDTAGAEAQMHLILEAYGVLSNPAKRAQYDLELSRGESIHQLSREQEEVLRNMKAGAGTNRFESKDGFLVIYQAQDTKAERDRYVRNSSFRSHPIFP